VLWTDNSRALLKIGAAISVSVALLAVCPAFGQVRVFMLEQGTSPDITPAGVTTVIAHPGEELSIFVWVKDPVGTDELFAYQMSFPWFASGGDSGTVSYLDNNPGSGGGDSLFLDKTNPLWVFSNALDSDAVPAVYNETPGGANPYFVVVFTYNPAVIDIGPNGDVPNPGGPNYLMQFRLQVSPDALGTFMLPFIEPPIPGPQAALFNVHGQYYGGPGGVIFEPLQIVICEPLPACADVAPADGVRDDACLWYQCVGGECQTVARSSQADLGGAFGACALDDTCDSNDIFHSLNCFSNINTLGTSGYPCEESPPAAINVDAGGPATCQLDGVCDGVDAFHALHCFANSWFDGSIGYQCGCGPQPVPPSAPRVRARPQQAGLTLRAPATAKPGELIDVDVHLDEGVKALRGYQLHLGARGGATAAIELVDISIDTRRRDYAFAKGQGWTAFNRNSEQMVAGMNEPEGIAVRAGSYLATFSYRVPPDARGTYSIELRHGGDALATTERTFLFGRHAELIDVRSITPAQVRVTD
jgi:hypothetical protein